MDRAEDSKKLITRECKGILLGWVEHSNHLIDRNRLAILVAVHLVEPSVPGGIGDDCDELLHVVAAICRAPPILENGVDFISFEERSEGFLDRHKASVDILRTSVRELEELDVNEHLPREFAEKNDLAKKQRVVGNRTFHIGVTCTRFTKDCFRGSEDVVPLRNDLLDGFVGEH